MSLSSSVSFRQGANVEFAGPAFVSTGDGKSGQDEVRFTNNAPVKSRNIKQLTVNELGLNIRRILVCRLIQNSD